MKNKILIVNICKERLHYYEFVKPIEDVLRKNKIESFTKDYKRINNEDLLKANKIIICGTSLKDNDFVKNLNAFGWTKNFNKPILGICGGMQIIGLLFTGKLKKKQEIGFYEENFKKEFLGLMGKRQVYHLHNYYVDFSKLNNFNIFASSIDGKIPQAIKHSSKQIYGVLFHPEVRNKKIIEEFCRL